MKQRNRIAILNIASTLLLDGIAFFTAPLFFDLLGDKGYGVLSIYTIWTSVAAIVFTFQTQGTLANARVEYPEGDQEKYQSSVMSLSAAAYLVCAGLVLAFLGPVSRLLKLDKILVVLMLVQTFGTFCVGFLTTKLTYEFKAGWKMILSIGVTLATLGASFALILPMPQESRYLGRIVAISVTYGLIGIPACLYILFRGRTFYNKAYWKFCLYLAIPTVFYNLSDLILGQSDQVMIQRMLSEAMVGQYSLALRFGGIMFTIFVALNHTWCPYFFEDMRLNQGETLKSRSKNFLELFTVLSIGFVLLVTEVFHLIAPPEAWLGTPLIPVFASSYFINFLCTFPVNYEYYRKKTKVVAVVTIATSLANLGLNYVLILRFGMMGAALATCLSHGLQLALHYGYCRYVLGRGAYPFGVKLWGKYAAVYFAAVALVYLTPEQWFIRWPLGAAIGVWELWRIRKRKVLI